MKYIFFPIIGLFIVIQSNFGISSYEKYPSINNTPFSLLDEYACQEQVIQETIMKVADYQLKTYGNRLPKKNWLVGTFFSSFIAAYEVTGDDWYINQWQKEN